MTPKKAYEILKTNNKRIKKYENIVSQDAEFSYKYSRDVLKKRFKKAEINIAQNAEYSYYYALYILKKRFKLGELSISKSVGLSTLYASEVIHGKLPLDMHNNMLLFAIQDPNNYYVKKYFVFIEEQNDTKTNLKK